MTLTIDKQYFTEVLKTNPARFAHESAGIIKEIQIELDAVYDAELLAKGKEEHGEQYKLSYRAKSTFHPAVADAIDQFLPILFEVDPDIVTVARIGRTWFAEYNIYFNPKHSKHFSEFNKRYGQKIVEVALDDEGLQLKKEYQVPFPKEEDARHETI